MQGDRARSDHVTALDGLRGIAALVVVFRHCFNAVWMPLPLRERMLESPAALLLNGQGAVQVFFVLSGFVLASSLSRHRHRVDLGQYFVKRVFRIHPPYVFGVLFAWCAAFFYPQLPAYEGGLMPGVRNLATVHIDGGALLRSLLFPGPADLQLPVGWTLRVEMIFSFLLPLMVWFARRAHWGLLLVASVAMLLHPAPILVYAIDFSLGIAAYLERDRLLRWGRAAPRWLLSLGALLALLVLHAPLLLGWSVAERGMLVGGLAPRDIGVMAFGAVGLVIAALCVPGLARWLSGRACRFLGRISYSLYLLHGAIMVLCTVLLSGPPSVSAGVAFTIAVVVSSIAISTLAYRVVERPSIALGNRICRWLAARAGTPDVSSKLVVE